ncbi:MAG: TIR domain-containing protein [Candidatus Binataceae bacterium]
MAGSDGEERTTAAKTDKPDVFISYASQDAAIATIVVETLERGGVACWIAPRDVTPGAFYADEIVHAIDAAKAIVLILSNNAADSQHVLREVEHAASRRHPVVSLRVDQAPLPAGLGYFLNTSQWLDASGGEIARSMPKLIAAVRVAIQAPVVTPQAALTPRGPAPSLPARPAKNTAIIVASLIGLVIAGFAVDRLWISSRRAASSSVQTAAVPAPASAPAAPAIPEKSVAVLPFVDMSEKKDQEYFSDGLSEELIDRLAHTADLKVIARTSSFQFKGKNEDMRTIGQRLGVANLLEGSVRKSGKTMRITAQLIKVSDGSHLWSQSYDRDVHDIFKVQDEIAIAVVTALQATITKSKSPSNDKPVNIEAYNAVLRGRYLFRKQTKQDTERGISMLQEAIRLDPTYAATWAALALGYNSLLIGGWVAPKAAYTAARKAVDRALAIDPNLASAHDVLSILEWNYNHDVVASEAEFRRARELEPDPASDADNVATLAAIAGQLDEAIRSFQKEVKYDPLDPMTLGALATALLAANRLPEAERVARSLLELEPNVAGGHCLLGEVLLAENKPEAAFAVMSEEPDEGSRITCLPQAMWELGRRAEADAMLAKAENKYGSSLAYWLAETYAVRDDKNAAFKWLARADENHESYLMNLKWDPWLNNLHGDPRFTAWLRKLNLPE